jgi:hypothetical protein
MRRIVKRLIGVTVATLVVACIGQATPIYLDEGSFVSGFQAGYYLETYSGYSGGAQASSMNFSQGGFSYTASAPGNLWITTLLGNALSTNSSDTAITFDFTSGNVTAVGGYFYLTTFDEQLAAGNIVLNLSDGTTHTLVNPGTSSFVGFSTEGGTLITSLVVNPGGGVWGTVDDFYVGTTIPETSTAGLLGLGLIAFAWFARHRKFTRS